MSDPIEGHEGWETQKLELALEEGVMILGYTVQLKVMYANGNTGYSTRQSGDLNDVEAMGMVRTHLLCLDRDIMQVVEDPHD